MRLTKNVQLPPRNDSLLSGSYQIRSVSKSTFRIISEKEEQLQGLLKTAHGEADIADLNRFALLLCEE